MKDYNQVRIAQEKTKQVVLICLTVIGVSIVAIPTIKGVQDSVRLPTAVTTTK